jgi:hypothetical protein
MKLFLLALSIVPAAVRAGCPGEPACSGKGVCNGLNCECFAGFMGGACEQRSCPVGAAWADIAVATDDAHNLAECSGVGNCDRGSGTCACAANYAGLACERLTCANLCSMHGKCVSMYDFNHYKNDDYEYSAVRWDAHKITGCICDDGWGGNDCSIRVCPSGDDPLTKSQVNEQQRFQCEDDLDDTAVKSFHLKWKGSFSPTIYSSDSRDTLVTKLRTMRSVYGSDTRNSYSGISASFSNSTYDRVCAPGYQTVTLTFTQDFGDLPDMSIKTNPNSPDFLELLTDAKLLTEDVKGTRENKVCGGRGLCNVETGVCFCNAGFASGDGSLTASAGLRGDCSYNSFTVAACGGEIACSGHGVCSSSPQYLCTCSIGWQGTDCSERTCPEGPAFFDLATSNDVAHASVECSNNGICERTSGACVCRPGFTGEACDRIDCANDGSKWCSGHGTCLSMRQLAQAHKVVDTLTYGDDLFNLDNTWDADRIHGCDCDTGFGGYDCSKMMCPTGKDPTQYPEPVFESQEIRCERTDIKSTTGWGIYLTFRRQKTTLIPVTASVADLKSALEALSSVEAGGLTVTYSNGTELCACSNCTIGSVYGLPSTKNVATVTWVREGGDVPLIQHVDPMHATEITATVSQSVQGTHVVAPCSNKGSCDERYGVCTCYPGWGSSDGMHGVGTHADCGYKIPIVAFA